MTGAAPGGLTVASRWRRVAAALIDLVVFVVPVIVLAVTGGLLYARLRAGRDAEPGAPRPFRLSRRWRLALAVAVTPLQVRGRNWRSPGWRMMGLRRVDAGTGGPVSVRSALVQHAFRTVWSEVTSQLLRPWTSRSESRLEAMFAEADAAGRAHPEGGEARQRALAEVFKRDRVGLSPGCAARALVVVTADLPAPGSALRQTVPERLAGTVVVQD